MSVSVGAAARTARRPLRSRRRWTLIHRTAPRGGCPAVSGEGRKLPGELARTALVALRFGFTGRHKFFKCVSALVAYVFVYRHGDCYLWFCLRFKTPSKAIFQHFPKYCRQYIRSAEVRQSNLSRAPNANSGKPKLFCTFFASPTSRRPPASRLLTFGIQTP